jgi:hypothetical protein
MLKQINSQCSFSKSYPRNMSEPVEQQWRQQRMADLSRLKGGNASLGRLLGYRDGAYVGQMIGGHRPITEKLIEKIHGMHGLSTWFVRDHLITPLTAQENFYTQPKTPRECLDGLVNILSKLDPLTREEVGDLLGHLARGLRPATKEAIIAVIEGAGKTERQKAA